MCVTFVLALASNQKKKKFSSREKPQEPDDRLTIPLASLHRLMELCILDLRHYA